MRKYFIYSKIKFSVLAIFKVLVAILFVGLAFVTQTAIEMIAKPASYQAFAIFIVCSVLYVILLGFAMVLKEYVTAKYCNKCATLLKNDYVKGILNLHIYDYLTKETGGYFSILMNDIGMISNQYFRNKLDLIDDIATFIVAFLYAVYIHYVMALFMSVVMLVVFILPFMIHKPLNKANVAYLKYLEKYTATCKNFLSGMVVIKSCQAEKIVFPKIEKCHEKLYKMSNRVNYYTVLANNLPMALVAILQLSSVLLAGFLALRQSISVGMVAAVLQLGNSFYSPVCQIIGRLSLIKSTKDINESVLRVTSEALTATCDEKLGLKTSIRMENVSFGYDKKSPVIQNFSMVFKKGGKYLIEGESGSGKSTLLKLMAKILLPDSGKLYWDAQPYDEMDEKTLFSSIGYVGQDAFVLNDSIRNNIDILKTEDDDKLLEVIQACKLDSWIEQFDNGWDTQIDEEIMQVSGGQKMRIALARVLYLQPEVLLLDEITSSLDAETAFAIESFLLKYEGTVIHVAHKSAEVLKGKYERIRLAEGKEG